MATSDSKRRVTATDVARAAGVSRATVGFVLNETPGQSISSETRRRVLDAAGALGYRPSSSARTLVRGRSDVLLLVMPDWPVNEILARFLERLSGLLDEAGYCLVAWVPPANPRTRPLWESIDADAVLGFAIFDEERVAALEANGFTNIFPTRRDVPRLDDSGFTAASRLQVDHLAELGHRRVAFAGAGDPRLAELEEYHLGTIRARAAAFGVTIVDARPVSPRGDSAAHAVRAWLDAGCTGVIAYNDETAATVIAAALRLGVSVPGDLSVVGHDDSPLAELFVPGITSVRPDVEALAREIAAEALRVVGAPPIARVDAEVVVHVRASTGPPGGG
ncbi:LacI family transcriptional regulator [Yinghuangia sp. ASG 101]|uniref:LacI family DNA-binding transcriptional regulator n=1 Tax=Yinghuangia sp. ASG 101 TaxID=2896848 RepID=UPI001E4C47C0|nr:LacI family DNA-binding transcriptional regulator [Yinghuangia sp. ASG 101]UGQ11947.1 LacI family transcriptional regulator [Yinghuangia sp. ASG 101]